MNRRYITTAIDYPNAAPHMGHVLEKVLADVIARWFRLRGDDVRFQIGTDEHGIKIQRTAEKEGMTPRELVDRNVLLFTDLYERLNISHDKFVRTSDEKEHYPTVTELWKRLEKSGALEKRSYTGFYCSGCERFMGKRDLVEGKCPNHQVEPEEVTEENWFLKMSEYTKDLGDLLTKEWDKEQYRIVPSFREKETLSLIEQGLEDVSFSRSVSSLQWGIPVPNDSDQVMYVWCDALTNYISGLGFLTDHEEREWWDDAKVTHVIGKDIARFHALIWPLMLKKADIRIPDELLIHGFLTSEGEKMSKSLGNVVVPDDVLKKFDGNPDPLRFYLSHEVPVGRDGDFSWERFTKLYDSILRNKLGNLLNRVLVLLKKEDCELIISDSDPLSSEIVNHWDSYLNQMDSFEVSTSITNHPVALVEDGNLRMDEKKPWTLSGEEKIEVLSAIAEMLRHISLMLLPIVPDTAYRISRQLNVPYAKEMLSKDFVITQEMKEWGGCKDWTKIGEPEILFAPLE
ncbi:methionine--tRNA ligase [Candidatus Peregrinibacteria bacterium]|jgi:methionyl-tRNA synthetase|nr:methionine--tRNA ligase [Candidatus Peregrinibacteria bacterium]MBT3598884.1 methionine--tRNA ligase [Candidatus Peregrinibacteria bacterium]MBT6730627.1 methionine--tRNA ligase [Candidatus Peregrinibacteria bacterium]MBT7009815.1 methionine--tRNA ligase [Candidatus Peregrinibacteria bacterium]MBT7344929.1 methionine--tRNA ligase [Candidatus Peregrinibacteria bacterium]